MIGGHSFKRIHDRRKTGKVHVQPNRRSLLTLLSTSVVERFARLNDGTAPLIPLALSLLDDTEEPPDSPCHPTCETHAGDDYCHESWQLHLAELRQRPEAHWHKCDYGVRCGLIPVVFHERCLAAIKLACPDAVSEKDFARQVELLDVLVKDFVTANADFLSRLIQVERATDAAAMTLQPGDPPAAQQPTHPQVLRALQYIEEHLADPKLTVSRIARELDIHPYYLGHLFAEQVGKRMGRFIAAQRIGRAKVLLATTDWQIKRIARETGHANPNWFCHVFGVHAGLTPGMYRRLARNGDAGG